jgi:hypothetical protein
MPIATKITLDIIIPKSLSSAMPPQILADKSTPIKKETKIANPPKLGILPLWTLRLLGLSKKPLLRDMLLISGVKTRLKIKTVENKIA